MKNKPLHSTSPVSTFTPPNTDVVLDSSVVSDSDGKHGAALACAESFDATTCSPRLPNELTTAYVAPDKAKATAKPRAMTLGLFEVKPFACNCVLCRDVARAPACCGRMLATKVLNVTFASATALRLVDRLCEVEPISTRSCSTNFLATRSGA